MTGRERVLKSLKRKDKNGFPSFIETENYSLVNRTKDFAKNELHKPQRIFIWPVTNYIIKRETRQKEPKRPKRSTTIKTNRQKIHNDPKQAKTSFTLLGTSVKIDFLKNALHLSVNVLSTKVLIVDTIFTSPNRRDRHFTWSSEPREGLAV